MTPCVYPVCRARHTGRVARWLLALGLLLAAACVPDPTTGRPPSRSEAVPSFTWSVSFVDAPRLGSSWRPGCPVGPGDLRLVSMDHWGYDGRPRRGELVVHADAVDAMVSAF